MVQNKVQDKYQIEQFFQRHQEQNKKRIDKFQELNGNRLISDYERDIKLKEFEEEFQKGLDQNKNFKQIKMTFYKIAQKDRLKEIDQDVYMNCVQVLTYQQVRASLYNKLKEKLIKKKQNRQKEETIKRIREEQQALL